MRWLGKQRKQDANQRRRPTDVKPGVFSYYARGASPSDQNTGRNQNAGLSVLKRYRLRLGHIPSYMALAAILIALGNACLLQPNPKIILVSTPDTVHRDPKTYQEAVQAIWKKSVFNRTKLTISTAAIRRDIAGQFTELAAVQIELPLLGRRPTVILTPTKPALQLVNASGSFYVDADGKVMARTTDLLQNDLQNVPVVHDETGISVEPGKAFIPAAEASFLRKLYAQLRAEEVAVTSITLPLRAANEADVRVDGQRYYIKFSIDSDPRQAVGTYLAVKAKLDAEGIVPTEYIDVRVDEKVFYR